jgi:hypothetical protein
VFSVGYYVMQRMTTPAMSNRISSDLKVEEEFEGRKLAAAVPPRAAVATARPIKNKRR